MKFCTIQFIDSHSESIPNKNLLFVDGKRLYEYNVDAVNALKKEVGPDVVLKSYIITPYSEGILPTPEGFERIPTEHFNTGVCTLSERVKDATEYIYAYDENEYDAYILLLGNVRTFRTDLLPNAIKTYELLSDVTNGEITGLYSVSNINMYSPYRATRLGVFGEASLVVKGTDGNLGEEKESGRKDSYFFDGGVMMMNANYEFNVDDTGATQFPYLGNVVVAMRQRPMDSIELDARWQFPLLLAENHAYCGYEG